MNEKDKKVEKLSEHISSGNAKKDDVVIHKVDDSATVKKFYKEKGFIRLQPQNQFMQPILVPTCTILGVVCGVFRKM